MADAWIGVIGALAGAVVGALISELGRYFERSRQQTRSWSALRAEVERCAADAQGFLDSKVKAPLGRLPNDAYKAAISAGALSTTGEHSAFATFYSSVDQLNRGLDRVADAVDNAASHVRDEDERNRLKARRIVHGGDHYALIDKVLTARLV